MMKYVHRLVGRLHSNDDGVTALEYALIASLIAVAIITMVQSTGTNVGATFTKVADKLK